MNPVKGLMACAVVLLGASFNGVAAPTDPLGKTNRLPPSLEQIARTVTEELTHEGYEVERGYWRPWGTEQCKYTISVLGRCFGPNPTAPYAMPFVPSWPDEFVDHSLHKVFGTERRGYPQIYRFDEREALVVFASMPPPGAYFGLQTYVFTREGKVNEEDPIYRGVPSELVELLFAPAPDPLRLVVWSTIGDSINNVVIGRQTRKAWQKDQQRFFIVTPDRATASDVTAALRNAGVGDSQVFVEPVAADLVRLGLDAAADDFQTVASHGVSTPHLQQKMTSDQIRRKYHAYPHQTRTGSLSQESRRLCTLQACRAPYRAMGGRHAARYRRTEH